MDKTTQQNLLDLVKGNYDEIAVSFNSVRRKSLWPGLVKLAAPVKDGDRVLDVGCGNGRLLQALAGKNIEYLGLDESVKLIDLARSNWKMSAGLRDGNWQFMTGNILKLDKLPDQDYDYVFCIAVLHHLPGKDLRIEALKQMKDKVKADGKIIITVWNLWRQKKFSRLIHKFTGAKIMGKHKMDFGDILFDWKNNLGQPVSRRYYHAFTKRELIRAVKQAGLRLEKLYKDKYNYYAVLRK